MTRTNVRPFAPRSLGDFGEQKKCLIESRLECSGEYVEHCPANGDPQLLVMNYVFIPESENYEGFSRPSATPVLRGLIDHFQCAPKPWAEGRGKAAQGSYFIVRGLRHIVRAVHVNHLGSIRIILHRDDKCAEPDADWLATVEGLTPCSPAPACADT